MDKGGKAFHVVFHVQLGHPARGGWENKITYVIHNLDWFNLVMPKRTSISCKQQIIKGINYT